MPGRPAFTEFGDQVRRLASPLGPRGDLARSGAAGRVQHDYALLVSEAVSRVPEDGKPGLLAIEADTGIGKTLGYLVPVLSRAVETGQRVCIATATRQLARQIIEHDGPAACAAVARIHGRAPAVALRLGKSNFILISAGNPVL
jgi:Rad3-related DNA helicase